MTLCVRCVEMGLVMLGSQRSSNLLQKENVQLLLGSVYVQILSLMF